MATGKKRTGHKNSHQKAKFARHFGIARKNKARRIEKDRAFKEAHALKRARKFKEKKHAKI